MSIRHVDDVKKIEKWTVKAWKVDSSGTFLHKKEGCMQIHKRFTAEQVKVKSAS